MRAMPRTWMLVALALSGCSCRSQLPYEGKSVAEVEQMLQDERPDVQAQGAYACYQDADKARQLVPALTAALKSPNGLVRQYAAQALGKAGPEAATAVPVLTAALKDSRWKVQQEAAVALGKIGAAAKPAVPALTRLSGDTHLDRVVREAAKKALQQIQAAGK
jgi:HEAT repeat protein